MPLQMVMHRNRVVRTLSGHSIAFEKGVPITVPDLAVKECIQVGAIAVDGELPDEVHEDLGDEKKIVDIPADPTERKNRILKLFKEMQKNQEGHRSHFTAAGRPRSNYVSLTLGYDVAAQEIEDIWQEMVNPVEDD